jgi:hypothetical protein
MITVIVLAVVMIGAATATLTKVRRLHAMRRRMQDAPQQILDHAAVTLTGTVRPVGEPLVAPLSGRPCVFHRSTARTYRPGPRNSRILDGEHTRVELVPFVLVTREAEVLVEGEFAQTPAVARAIIPRKIRLERKFLADYAPDKDARGSGFDEIVIAPGATVSVHGIARVEVAPAQAAGYRETGMRVRLVGDGEHPLTIMPA